MVQKSFIALVINDVEISFRKKLGRFPAKLEAELAANEFKNDQKSSAILMKVMGGEWKDKCERSLLLSK